LGLRRHGVTLKKERKKRKTNIQRESAGLDKPKPFSPATTRSARQARDYSGAAFNFRCRTERSHHIAHGIGNYVGACSHRSRAFVTLVISRC